MPNKLINWINPSGDTCRVVSKSGNVYGLFYDSKSKLRHIAKFIPYESVPKVSLCDKDYINFSGTGSIENICNICKEQLIRILNEA